MNTFREALKSMGETAAKKSGVQPDDRLRQLLSKPRLRRFRQEHPTLTRQAYIRSMNRLDQYVREWDTCDNCPGLQACTNLAPGHQPYLIPYAGYIDLHLRPCSLKKQEDMKRKRENKIRSHYIPQDVLAMTFEQLDLDAAREEAIFAAMRFAATFGTEEQCKGLYLYGDFGVGKSCIAGALAQDLAQRNIPVYMVFVPEFFRELKESIQDGSTTEKVEQLKNVDVLILDDLGAEMLSPWLRDEILGSILQYRVSKSLPTIFTSNLSYEELEEHLSYSQKNGFEALKAGRIMERIKHETDAYHVGGANRRS